MTKIVFAAPDFSMMGFATTGGGTTGGGGGAVVTPSTLDELKQYAEDPITPYEIRITKEFNSGVAVTIDSDGSIASSGTSTTYGAIIMLGSNKSLIGIDSGAFFNRIGIVIQCQSNIIIRNITFTMKDVPIARTNENKIVGWVNGKAVPLGDPDCIAIQADDDGVAEKDRRCRNIWIDHCEFYNENPEVMTDKDRYDGLVDGKNNSSAITVSWCYFHDHHKASLMGKGNSDDFDRQITYSHNYFKNIAGRLPLIRYGDCHLLNNCMVKSENGANARINSDLYVEANWFEDSKKPVFGKVSEKGAATFVDNRWISCSRVPQAILDAGKAEGADPLSESEELLQGSFKPSTVYPYTVDPVEDVKTMVTTYAGVGIVDTGATTEVRTVLMPVRKPIFAYGISRRIIVNTMPGTPVTLCNLAGGMLYRGSSTQRDQVLSFRAEKGVYVVRMGERAQTVVVPE